MTIQILHLWIAQDIAYTFQGHLGEGASEQEQMWACLQSFLGQRCRKWQSHQPALQYQHSPWLLNWKNHLTVNIGNINYSCCSQEICRMWVRMSFGTCSPPSIDWILLLMQSLPIVLTRLTASLYLDASRGCKYCQIKVINAFCDLYNYYIL